jgi:hypothetical protein
MTYHYKNSPTDELRVRMCNGQINRQGNLSEYFRREEVFIEELKKQREFEETIKL